MADHRAAPTTWRAPGLVDIQINGFAGFDFNSDPSDWKPDDFLSVREALHRHATVIALPTLITDAPEAMLARARRYAEIVRADAVLAATFPKLHIEGPFISAEDGPRGAHPAQHASTAENLPDLIAQLQRASGGRVGILTLAPELPGAIELTARCGNEGICVAIGHTAAPNEAIRAAVDAGARLSTHLGNGSHQLLPRLDNYVQAQLAEDRLFASFIADGHHMPYATLQNFIRAKTPERSILVTDAIAAADRGPGRYLVAGMEVEVSEAMRVSKPGEPNLAGSALALDRAVMNVFTYCPFGWQSVWRMASTNPAALLGLPKPPEVVVRIESDRIELLEIKA